MGGSHLLDGGRCFWTGNVALSVIGLGFILKESKE